MKNSEDNEPKLTDFFTMFGQLSKHVSFAKHPPDFKKYENMIQIVEEGIGELTIPWKLEDIDDRSKANMKEYLIFQY